MAIQIPTVSSPLTLSRPVVDDVSVRLVAALVLALVTLTAATGQWWLYGVLALDFALRTAGLRRLSPLGVLVQHVARRGYGWPLDPPPPPRSGSRLASARCSPLPLSYSGWWASPRVPGRCRRWSGESPRP